MPESATWGPGRTGPPSTFMTKLSGIVDSIFKPAIATAETASAGIDPLFNRVNQILRPINQAVETAGRLAYTVGEVGSRLGGGGTFEDIRDVGAQVARAPTDVGLELDRAQQEARRAINSQIDELRSTESSAQRRIASGLLLDVPDPDSITRDELAAMSPEEAKARFGLSDDEYNQLRAVLGLPPIPGSKDSGSGRTQRYGRGGRTPARRRRRQYTRAR